MSEGQARALLRLQACRRIFLRSQLEPTEMAATGERRYEIPLRKEPAFTPHRKLKIVTVGCGFSALIFTHKLQHQHPELQELVTHKILEQRDDIGGTWLVNTYPGVQCDVPAHIYVCTVSSF